MCRYLMTYDTEGCLSVLRSLVITEFITVMLSDGDRLTPGWRDTAHTDMVSPPLSLVSQICSTVSWHGWSLLSQLYLMSRHEIGEQKEFCSLFQAMEKLKQMLCNFIVRRFWRGVARRRGGREGEYKWCQSSTGRRTFTRDDQTFVQPATSQTFTPFQSLRLDQSRVDNEISLNHKNINLTHFKIFAWHGQLQVNFIALIWITTWPPHPIKESFFAWQCRLHCIDYNLRH